MHTGRLTISVFEIDVSTRSSTNAAFGSVLEIK